jgi:type II secretory pathway pseudopilin PulG
VFRHGPVAAVILQAQRGPPIPTAAEQARRTDVVTHSARPGRSAPGYSYIELLVSLGIVSILLALLVPLIGRSRASAQSVACLAQLRQIGAGFLQYAADNDRRLPDPFMLQRSWEQILQPYVANADTFRCAGDHEMYPMVGSSYDWRDTGRRETTMAGKVITDTDRAECVLAFEALPGWHARGRMNAVLLNGSVLAMDQELCMGDLQTPIRPLPAEEKSRLD